MILSTAPGNLDILLYFVRIKFLTKSFWREKRFTSERVKAIWWSLAWFCITVKVIAYKKTTSSRLINRYSSALPHHLLSFLMAFYV